MPCLATHTYTHTHTHTQYKLQGCIRLGGFKSQIQTMGDFLASKLPPPTNWACINKEREMRNTVMERRRERERDAGVEGMCV